MALSVGTDPAVLLMAASPEAGPRRTPASPKIPQPLASPQGFADLLAGLPQDHALPNVAPAPLPASAIAPASPIPGPRGGAPVATAWPWASLAAAAEEAAALAGQFRLPSPSTAMPAGDAALPEAPEASEAAEPEPAATPLPPLVLPPLEPCDPQPQLATPLSLPQPPAEPAAAPVLPAEQRPVREPAAAIPPQPAATAPVPPATAVRPGIRPAASPPPAPAREAEPTAVPAASIPTGSDVVSAAPEATSSVRAAAAATPLPQAIGAATTDTASAAQVPEQPVPRILPTPRQPAERRPSTQPGAATSAAAPTMGERRLSGTAGALPASDAILAERPAGPEAGTAPLPVHSPAMPEAAAPAEAEAGGAGGRLEAVMPSAAPAAVAAEPRREAPRAATPAGPAMPRPHLPPEAGQQLALRVVTAAANRVESVSVDLRPPELGKVELRLTFHDGTVQVSMAAERGDTFEALRQDRAHLEQQIQQAGLQLGGGGLDLQHGHLPREAPEPAPALSAHADGNDAAEEEPDTPRPPPSDSLIDLIA